MSDSSDRSPGDSGHAGLPGVRARARRLAIPRPRRFVPSGRRGRLIGAVALLAVAGLTAWWVFGRPQAAPADTRQTLTISASTLRSTVTASGTLEPERRADLTLPSGTVSSVRVAPGDEVTAGETLAAIDPAALEIAVSSASADLTAAQETLADLRSSSASTASINAASASVQVKQNALTQAKADLTAATLTAPFDGVVAEVNVAEGDAGGSSSGGASSSGAGAGSGAQTGGASGQGSSGSSAAIVLISKDAFTVSTSVSSGDVGSLKRGLQATITPSGSSQTVYGTVASVGVIASSSTSGSSTFPVTIDITGTHDDLRAGSTVSVEIVTKQLTDVIAVPTQALATGDGGTTVTKLVDGAEVATAVTTGETLGSQTVITEGLAEGDQIVMTGFRVASGGSQTGQQETNGFPAGGGLPEGMQPPSGGQGGPGGQGGFGGQGRGNR